MTPRALITGITGQDGSYLAELLLEKGYHVVGMVRRASTENFERIAHLRDRIELRQADLLDQLSLIDLLQDGASPTRSTTSRRMSFVPTSWQQPVLTAEFDAVGVTRMLEAIRLVAPEARFYQASSSEMFGKVRETPQSETTPFHPRSPYGVAKVVRALHHGQLPRELRAVRLLGHPLQPREPAARARVRHPQGLRRRGAHHARVRRRSSRSATSTRGATGASPATTSTRCGGCCSSPSPTTTWSRPARRTRCASWSRSRSPCVGLDWREHVRAGPGAAPAGRGRSPGRRRDEGAARCSAGAPRVALRRAGRDDGARRPRSPARASG